MGIPQEGHLLSSKTKPKCRRRNKGGLLRASFRPEENMVHNSDSANRIVLRLTEQGAIVGAEFSF